MTTHNDDAVREVTRQQRAERRNATRTPRNDEPTPADLTRELHLMETQVAEHGFPGTRAVLDLIGDLRKENAKHRELLREVAHSQAEPVRGRPEAVALWRHSKTWKQLQALDQRNP